MLVEPVAWTNSEIERFDDISGVYVMYAINTYIQIHRYKTVLIGFKTKLPMFLSKLPHTGNNKQGEILTKERKRLLLKFHGVSQEIAML